MGLMQDFKLCILRYTAIYIEPTQFLPPPSGLAALAQTKKKEKKKLCQTRFVSHLLN